MIPSSVLFLEDEPLIAMDTGEFLADLGVETITLANTLEDAETAVSANSYDVAILDINVDGGQQSYAIGERLMKSGTPVIFVSGTEIERSRLSGEGYLFLAKPYRLDGLRALISETQANRAGAEG